MPWLWALGGLLVNLVRPLVGRILLALGISYVTFKGFDVSTDWLFSQIKSNIGAMPSEVIAFLGWLWIDRAIGMVFSVFTACMVVRMAGSDSVTRMITRGGGS